MKHSCFHTLLLIVSAFYLSFQAGSCIQPNANFSRLIQSVFTVEAAADNSGPNNQSQFVYIVGVEGSGHHGAFQVIEQLAAQSGFIVHPRDRSMRSALKSHLRINIVKAFTEKENVVKGKHVFLEDSSFPTLSACREATSERIKQECPRYDFQWAIKTIQDEHRDTKIILLTRNFVNQLWSHKGWDGGIRNHTHVLAEYMHFISDELSGHFLEKEGMWARVDYKEFSTENCPKTIPHLAKFLGWVAPADLKSFCNSTGFRLSKKEPRIEEEDMIWLDEIQRSNEMNWIAYTRPEKAVVTASNSRD